MRLQITDGRGDVAVQDSGARPLRVGEAGRLFSAAAIGFVLGSAIAPQEPAKISYVRRPKRNAAAPP
jgi:hypothetical protein